MPWATPTVSHCSPVVFDGRWHIYVVDIHSLPEDALRCEVPEHPNWFYLAELVTLGLFDNTKFSIFGLYYVPETKPQGYLEQAVALLQKSFPDQWTEEQLQLFWRL